MEQRDHEGNTTLDSLMSVDRKSRGNRSGKQSTVSSGMLPPSSSVQPSGFLVSVTGRIESAEIFGVDDVYCKYNLAFGNDWSVTSVQEAPEQSVS